METRALFFIGKPGCGKGTQAKMLSEATGLPVFASGDLFRAIAKEDTPVGHKMKTEMEQGLLAPPWFAMYLYLKQLFSIPENSGAIFDGFNRKLHEAELVVDSFKWLGRQFIIFNITVSDEEVQKRLSLRKNIEGRADDSAVTKRLEEYHTFTEPALELFRASGHLIEINGEQTPEEVSADVRKALGV